MLPYFFVTKLFPNVYINLEVNAKFSNLGNDIAWKQKQRHALSTHCATEKYLAYVAQ